MHDSQAFPVNITYILINIDRTRKGDNCEALQLEAPSPSVASLRLVSPGALTDGVALFVTFFRMTTTLTICTISTSPDAGSFVQCSCKFNHRNILTSITVLRVTPWMVSPEAISSPPPPLPSNATGPRFSV